MWIQHKLHGTWRRMHKVPKYVMAHVTQTHDEDGYVEGIESELRHTQEVLVNLVDVLAQKKILNADEITKVVEEYNNYDEAKIIPADEVSE